MDRLFALSLGFAGLILIAHAGNSQTLAQAGRCGARAEVLELLTGKFRETRQGLGLAGESAVLELYASRETGTWTVAVTLADGRTCLIASGNGWEATEGDAVAIPGSPA